MYTSDAEVGFVPHERMERGMDAEGISVDKRDTMQGGTHSPIFLGMRGGRGDRNY